MTAICALRRLGCSQLTQTRWSGGNLVVLTESTQIAARSPCSLVSVTEQTSDAFR